MKYISDNEILSAYIDGELSTEEKNDLEQRLNYSPELKSKLDELLKIKTLVRSAVRELPESPYFETRFSAELKDEKREGGKLRRYFPALGFSLLAVILMVVLKLNPGMIDNLLEEQKVNIASFYKENLKPLLYAANLTNEDIFNFAFSSRIPLDEKEGQILQLGYDEAGKEFFEIRNVKNTPAEGNNLEKFVTALKLNEIQRKQVDSILESYADDLETQILVNEKNTLAVNPNLWHYNKAIAAELLAFASASNNHEFKKIAPSAYTPPKKGELMQYVSEVKTARDNEYIFFTPDSIFSEVYEFDKGKFRIEMEKERKELDREMKHMDNELRRINVMVRIDSSLGRHHGAHVDHSLKVYVDSNSCRVMVPAPPMDIHLPMLDNLDIYLKDMEKEMKEFSFRMDVPEPGKPGVYNFNYNDSTATYNFSIPDNIHTPDLDSLLKYHDVHLDSLKMPNLNFYYNTDSLSSMMQFFMNDTLNQEFKIQMQQLEEEMKQFREEMQELRKDIKIEKKKKTTVKKPLEI